MVTSSIVFSLVSNLTVLVKILISITLPLLPDLEKEFPNIGSQFSKSGKSGKVIEINIFTRTVKLETKENTIEEVTI